MNTTVTCPRSAMPWRFSIAMPSVGAPAFPPFHWSSDLYVPASRTWRRWAAGRSQDVVVAIRNLFPYADLFPHADWVARLPITIPGRRRNSPAREYPRPHPGRPRRYPTRSTPLTTALAMPPAINKAVADLLLVRMALPSKIPRAEEGAREDIGKLPGTDCPPRFRRTAERAGLRGLPTKGKRNTFALTDAGRERRCNSSASASSRRERIGQP